MERYFLVDYERVKDQPENGLGGIEMLTEKDTVFILFKNENISISFLAMKKLIASKAKIIQKVMPEDNDQAVENVLCYLIGKYYQREGSVFLITDDRHCFELLQTFTADDDAPADVSAFLTIQSAQESAKIVLKDDAPEQADKKEPEDQSENWEENNNDES